MMLVATCGLSLFMFFAGKLKRHGESLLFIFQLIRFTPRCLTKRRKNIILFMDDKTWQFRKLKSHCGGHLFCSVVVLIFFRASEAREMNTRLKGEEHVLKISPFTLKKNGDCNPDLELTNL